MDRSGFPARLFLVPTLSLWLFPVIAKQPDIAPKPDSVPSENGMVGRAASVQEEGRGSGWIGADEWLGFRGLSKQGRSEFPAPLYWSKVSNISWKAEIPGLGYSSPVVYGERVFLTTAHVVEGALMLGTKRARAFTTLLIMITGAFLISTFSTCGRGALKRSLLFSATFSVLVILIVHENWLAPSQSSIRAWFHLSLTGSLSLVLAGLQVPGSSKRWGFIHLALISIAASALLWAPRRAFIAYLGALGFPFCAMAIIRFGAVSPFRLVRRALVLRGAQGSRFVRLACQLCECGTFALVGLQLVTNINHVRPSREFRYAFICLDRNTGRILWISNGPRAPAGRIHRMNSYATPTPVATNASVVAYFGSPGLMCVDWNGRPLWLKTDLPFEGMYGVAASPTQKNGTVIVSSGGPKAPYLAAIEGVSGKEMWRVPRASYKAIQGEYGTPLILDINHQETVLTFVNEGLVGYNLYTGKVVCRYKPAAPLGDLVASIVADGDRIYLPTESAILAVNRRMLGVSGQNPFVWAASRVGARCSSPVQSNNLLYTVKDGGLASCLDVRTGEVLWKQRLSGSAEYVASITAAGAYVYFTDSAGVTTVVAASRRFEKISENDIGEPVSATPAVAGGQLFIRSDRHLFCIGTRNAKQVSEFAPSRKASFQ